MRAFVVPRAAALVTIDGARAEIVGHLGGRWSATFEGALAADVGRLAETRELSPRLEALAATHSAAAALARWRDEEWLPVTALDAVRLDGFDTLFLEVIGTCNERCLHCYADSSPAVQSALDRATCEAVIDDAAALGFRRLQLTGGDPLLCGFLPELVERAAAHPFEVREIYTNGLLLGDRLLDQLAPHRPSFAFSFYSHDPEIHDAITRTRGSQRRTRAAIERVVARGLAVRASVVVMAQNAAGVDATVDDLHALGVEHVAVTGSRQVGRGETFAWQGRSRGSAHRAGGARAEGKLAVTYQGEVVPCIFNRGAVLGRVGPARLRDVIAGLRDAPRSPGGGEGLSCASCQLTQAALGAVPR